VLLPISCCSFFNDSRTTVIYTLSLHDALPILSEALADAGFCVEQASNGLEALERVKQSGEPDVILLDLRMPEMDGRQFLERIRRSEEHTSELQSLRHLVCRLLLEKKKKKTERK